MCARKANTTRTVSDNNGRVENLNIYIFKINVVLIFEGYLV